MPAARLGYVSWYPADWLLSRTRLRLTPAGRSAYFDILMLCYQSEDGCIEWDLDYLRSLTGVGSKILTGVQRAFNERSTGRWTHPRVQSEIARIRFIQEQASRAGKESGKQRHRTAVERSFNERSTSRAEQSRAEGEKTPLKGGVFSPTKPRQSQRHRPDRPSVGRLGGAPSGSREELPAEDPNDPTGPMPSWFREAAGLPPQDPEDPKAHR